MTTTLTMTVGVDKYLNLTDNLTDLALGHAEAGNIATAGDYELAVGAILTLLTDFGQLDRDTLKPV
jgi:hypothetical protein